MAKATLSKLLKEVRTLTREEQAELREALEALLAEPGTRRVEEEVERRLFERGLLSEIKPHRGDPARHRAWKPIAVKGKPISQVIIEERR